MSGDSLSCQCVLVGDKVVLWASFSPWPQGGTRGAMSEAIQQQQQLHVTQLFEENTSNKQRPALAPQPNGLCAPVASTGRQGAPVTSSAPPAGSAPSKAKPPCMTPEQAMKQFMSKMSSYEHHEIFSFPEGESTPPPPPSAPPPPSGSPLANWNKL